MFSFMSPSQKELLTVYLDFFKTKAKSISASQI